MLTRDLDIKDEPLDSSGTAAENYILKCKYRALIVPYIREESRYRSLQDIIVICADRIQVRTSTLLLAAISPWLRCLMEEAGEEFCLCLPSVTSLQLENFLDNCLADNPEDETEELAHIHSMLSPRSWLSIIQSYVKQTPEQNKTLDVYGVKNSPLHSDYEDNIDDDMFIPTALKESKKIRKEKNMRRKKVSPKLKPPNRKLHKEISPKTLLCPDCGQEFNQAKKYDRIITFTNHMRKHQVNKFSCDCPEVPKLLIHPALSSPGELLNFGSIFLQKERHMREHHMGWFGCKQCLQSFDAQNKLDTHVKTHDTSFVCVQCGFETNSKSNLLYHTYKEHDTVQVTCPDCNKVYENAQTLRKHERKVHREKSCDICGAVVKNLKGHMEAIHSKDSDKKAQCLDCGKGFIDKTKLKNHQMNVHIKSNPFKCRYGCDMGYNDASNRNSHEKKLHGGLYKGEEQMKD